MKVVRTIAAVNRILLPGILILFSSAHVPGQDRPALSTIDRTRLAEAFRIGELHGDKIWAGWSEAPFAVLLVTPEHEFLIRHPKPSPDFTLLGHDAKLKSNVYYRKRKFPTHYLATFPAVPGSMVSTIVVGQAENTSAKTSTLWVITLLHEHFHQLQDSQPNFYEDVNALNLSRGDQTGMWMLNYAFPYEREDVQKQFEVMRAALYKAVKSGKTSDARAYLKERRKFDQLVTQDDSKYFAFQLWKEGIARYTEYHVGRLAGSGYEFNEEFHALKDFQQYPQVTYQVRQEILRQLQTQKLGELKREVVYAFGAAEGLLLDQIDPGWRRKYIAAKFDLRKLFPK